MVDQPGTKIKSMKTLIIDQVVNATEKAIEVLIAARREQDGEFHLCKCWLPRSQIRIIDDKQIEIPDWLYNAKCEDIGDRYDFCVDGLMSVDLPPSAAPSKEEVQDKWDAWTKLEQQKAARKAARQAKKTLATA